NFRQNIIVRHLDRGREVFRIATRGILTPDEVVHEVVFSPDDRLIALKSRYEAASFHRSAIVPRYRLVEVASGKEIVLREPADYPWTFFTTDGRVLAGAYGIKHIIAPVGGMMREDRPSLSVVDAVTGHPLGELPSYPMRTNPWVISPNGRFLASADRNHTILIWDLAQQNFKPPPKRKRATREELDKLWKELPSDDAPKAFRAGADLVALPEQSVSMLRERLKPVAAPPSESIAKHIKDLRSEKFAVRDKARIALEEMKELAEPALRRALEHELP